MAQSSVDLVTLDLMLPARRAYSAETWCTWEYWANKAGCGDLLTRPDGGHAHPPKG